MAADEEHLPSGAAGPSEDAWLASAFPAFESGAPVVLGLGHDCAAVRLAPADVAVVTTDVLVDGVHFRSTDVRLAEIAYKALAVNVSDLAAAAAEPVGFLIGAVLPRPVRRSLFDGLMSGFAEAARALDCLCLGGDTNSADGPLTLAVTAFGRPGPLGVVSRRGAQPGDLLSVTGALGGSLRGRHLHPQPRVQAALALARARVPKAMIDISDGLLRDLPRLCRVSQVGAVVDAEAVPIHADVEAGTSQQRLAQALGDGEDFELLLAHAEVDEALHAALAAEGVTLHAIGRVLPPSQGIRLLQGGDPAPWPAGGFDHLAG